MAGNSDPTPEREAAKPQHASLLQVAGVVLWSFLGIRKGRATHVREFAEGNAFVNYDSHGRLLGIELLGPCQVTVLDQLARKESPTVKNFLRKSIPREMALA